MAFRTVFKYEIKLIRKNDYECKNILIVYTCCVVNSVVYRWAHYTNADILQSFNLFSSKTDINCSTTDAIIRDKLMPPAAQTENNMISI